MCLYFMIITIVEEIITKYSNYQLEIPESFYKEFKSSRQVDNNKDNNNNVIYLSSGETESSYEESESSKEVDDNNVIYLSSGETESSYEESESSKEVDDNNVIYLSSGDFIEESTNQFVLVEQGLSTEILLRIGNIIKYFENNENIFLIDDSFGIKDFSIDKLTPFKENSDFFNKYALLRLAEVRGFRLIDLEASVMDPIFKGEVQVNPDFQSKARFQYKIRNNKILINLNKRVTAFLSEYGSIPWCITNNVLTDELFDKYGKVESMSGKEYIDFSKLHHKYIMHKYYTRTDRIDYHGALYLLSFFNYEQHMYMLFFVYFNCCLKIEFKYLMEKFKLSKLNNFKTDNLTQNQIQRLFVLAEIVKLNKQYSQLGLSKLQEDISILSTHLSTCDNQIPENLVYDEIEHFWSLDFLLLKPKNVYLTPVNSDKLLLDHFALINNKIDFQLSVTLTELLEIKRALEDLIRKRKPVFFPLFLENFLDKIYGYPLDFENFSSDEEVTSEIASSEVNLEKKVEFQIFDIQRKMLPNIYNTEVTIDKTEDMCGEHLFNIQIIMLDKKLSSPEVDSTKIFSAINSILNFLLLEHDYSTYRVFSQHQLINQYFKYSSNLNSQSKYCLYKLLYAEARFCKLLDLKYLNDNDKIIEECNAERKILARDILYYRNILSGFDFYKKALCITALEIRKVIMPFSNKDIASYVKKLYESFKDFENMDAMGLLYLRQLLYYDYILYNLLDNYIELCLRVELQFLYEKFIDQCYNLDKTVFESYEAVRFLYLSEIIFLKHKLYRVNNAFPFIFVMKKTDPLISSQLKDFVPDNMLGSESFYRIRYVDSWIPKPVNVYKTPSYFKLRDTLVESFMVDSLIRYQIPFELSITNDELKLIIDILKEDKISCLYLNKGFLELLDKIYDNPFENKFESAMEEIYKIKAELDLESQLQNFELENNIEVSKNKVNVDVETNEKWLKSLEEIALSTVHFNLTEVLIILEKLIQFESSITDTIFLERIKRMKYFFALVMETLKEKESESSKEVDDNNVIELSSGDFIEKSLDGSETSDENNVKGKKNKKK